MAACVEVKLDRSKGGIRVTEICEAFECGPILNPANIAAAPAIGNAVFAASGVRLRSMPLQGDALRKAGRPFVRGLRRSRS